MIRYWRQRQGISQMDLALEIDSSSRHLSFVETGKAKPGRELLRKLAEALRIPLRQRNYLLELAGYSREFSEESLDSGRMQIVHSAINHILAGHEPFPAMVVDGAYEILRANSGMKKLLVGFLGERASRFSNAVDVLFDPNGLQPYVRNWATVQRVLLARIRDEVFRTRNEKLAKLHAKWIRAGESAVAGDTGGAVVAAVAGEIGGAARDDSAGSRPTRSWWPRSRRTTGCTRTTPGTGATDRAR